jgi:hypothetical protein
VQYWGLLPCGMFAAPQDIQKLPLESQERGHRSLGVLILQPGVRSLFETDFSEVGDRITAACSFVKTGAETPSTSAMVPIEPFGGRESGTSK